MNGSFFFILLVMRITYGTERSFLLFLLMESEGRMKERNRGLSLWLILAFLGCIGGAKGEEIMNLHTEKSMYAPGETAEVLVEDLPSEAALLRLTLRHLESPVLTRRRSRCPCGCPKPTLPAICWKCRRWIPPVQ